VTESVKALTRIGFDQLGANRIEIRFDSRNERSRRIAARCGYQLEAKLKNDQLAPDGILRTRLYTLFFLMNIAITQFIVNRQPTSDLFNLEYRVFHNIKDKIGFFGNTHRYYRRCSSHRE